MSEILEMNSGEFTINTNQDRFDIDAIHSFLNHHSYWAKTRTRKQTETAIKNSLCFGVFKGDDQIGFARVVTDFATFAYLGDVFILEEFRGQGLSKWLMETIIDHPDLQGLRRWVLATKDAHSLYEKYGFSEFKHPERWMEKPAPDAY